MRESCKHVCLQAFYLQQQATMVMGSKEHSLPGLKLHYYPSLSQSSEESEGTKRYGTAALSAKACTKQCTCACMLIRGERQLLVAPHVISQARTLGS